MESAHVARWSLTGGRSGNTLQFRKTGKVGNQGYFSQGLQFVILTASSALAGTAAFTTALVNALSRPIDATAGAATAATSVMFILILVIAATVTTTGTTGTSAQLSQPLPSSL